MLGDSHTRTATRCKFKAEFGGKIHNLKFFHLDKTKERSNERSPNRENGEESASIDDLQ